MGYRMLRLLSAFSEVLAYFVSDNVVMYNIYTMSQN